PKFPNKVYKVVKALYGLHQAPRAWYATLSTFLERSGYRRRAIDKTSFIKKDKKDIMLFQVYVDDIIFGSTKKTWCDEFKELMKNSTPIETHKPLVKDKEAADVDVHLYRFQVTPKTSYLQAVKRIFRKSTTGGCQFLGFVDLELIIRLWVQLNEYKDLFDNESTICIVKNLVFQSKTKHIEIRHHFIRDAYEKKLLQMLKIHTDDNVVDLLTKDFDNVKDDKVSNEFKFIKEQINNKVFRYILQVIKTPKLKKHEAKPAESEGFEQILDFLNGSSVRYALTASPTIRTSCIKQFWSTTKVKTVNDEVRVQALIDGKKVTIKESSIRRTLSTMASAIICLATNQKFNFSRYILQSLVKNIEAGVPFYMFPRVITPLFESMFVQAAEKVGQAQGDISIPAKPSTSKPYKKHKSKKQQPIAPTDSLTLQELVDLCTRLSNKVLDLESEVIDIKSSFTDRIQKLEDRVDQLEEENRALKEKSFKTTQVDTAAPVENMEKSFKQGRMIEDMDEDDINKEEPAEVEEVLEVIKAAKLMTEVVTTAQPTTTAAQVPKPSAPMRRKGVIIQDHEETATSVIVHSEVQSKDKGKGILIEEPKPLKGQAQIDMDEAFARQLEAKLNANINWNDVIEQDNTVMRYQSLKRKPVTEAQARKNMMIYLKNMAGFKMDFFKEKGEEDVTIQEKEIKEEENKRQGESLKQEITKKQRIDEEAEELKTHLQIVIHHENNKPYYKIIRADETHKLFLSFITLLKNFDRENLETLWKIVKERFESTEPNNFSDDFLLNIFKIMFEKPNVEANVWRDQKGIYGLAKVKS
nr:hypothetical protein [Tanacetum cinerariifolium]